MKARSVSTRFNQALAAVVASALLIFAGVLILSDFVTASRELEARTHRMAKLAAESLEIPLWNLDDQTVTNIVSSFLDDEDVAYMAVYEDKQQIAVLSQSGIAEHNFEYFENSRNYLVAKLSIQHNDLVIGEVRLAVSRKRIWQELATNVILVSGVSALILIAILITSPLITRRYISRRLLALENGATAIAQGDLKAKVEDSADDEIGRLARNLGVMRDAISHLVEDLRSSQAELEQHNISLGQRVQERTAELERAIDAAREAQMQAEEANRAKSDFLSSMSHELRTPLNAIIGFTEFVVDDEDTPLTREQKTSLAEVLKAGRHLLLLINDVLDLTKIDAGAVALSIEAIDAGQIVDECISLMASFAANRNVELHNLVATAALPPISADRIRLKQVFLNLLSNAIKYNNDPGNVFIERGTSAPDQLRIGVRDEGPGIAEDRQAKLFEPFDRLGAENSAIEGTGIGLTITRNLVEKMGGTISVDSVVGEGSTFWVEMPISEHAPAHPVSADQPPIEAASDVEGLILYIEDNPANLELVRRIMSRQPGIDFIGAETGELGIERARAEVPDVILVDINLPGLDGFQVLKALSLMPETRHIPVIALTAAATDADIGRGQAAGFFSYLTKPVAARELIDTIRRALHPATSDGSDRPPLAPRGKVLVVDDARINLVLTERQLGKLAVECECVDDPLRALELLKTGSYAAALVDIGMPELNGIELTKQLRAAERKSGTYTPVIALTANYGSEEDVDRYQKAGMDGQLTKPVQLNKLSATLHRWFAPRPTSSGTLTAAKAGSRILSEEPRGPVDLEQFRAIHGSDDAATLRDIFRLFIDVAPAEVENLSKAVAARDVVRTTEAAQRLGSAAANTAARRLADLLQQMERQTRDGGDLDALLESVREQWQTVEDYMRARI